MFEHFKAWFGRLVAAAKIRLAGWFRRKKPYFRGTSISGEHRESSGRLVYAPLVSPKRGYRLYFPAGYRIGERLPLMVMLHGCKQNSESFAAGTRINLFADRARFCVLYPEQTGLANPYHCWNWFDPSNNEGNGEVAIIAAMAREVAKEHNVDASRIYVAGLSAGGALASALASCHADVFAACAVHSGLMFQAANFPAAARSAMQNGSERDPEKAGERAYKISGDKVGAMPVLVIHGDADETVHPVNAQQIIAQFLAMNRHGSQTYGLLDTLTARTTEKTNGSGYRYEIRDYGPEVAPLLRHVTVKGMGHAWSGGNPSYPFNDPRGPMQAR
ncbi:MAG: PHB depolymerase family esterase [Burkholderiales bacterium]